MPYPHRLLLDILPQNTPNSQNLLLRCPPTDFTDLHRYLLCAVLPQNSQNSQNLAAWVWQECHTLLHLCSSVPSVGGSSLSEVSVRSVRSVGISFLPRISQICTDAWCVIFNHGLKRMFSHGIHRIWLRGYGKDVIPSYICGHPCHLWEAFLSKRFCVFRAFCGIICPPTDFTDLHRWSVCAELNHRLSGNYCANLTTSPSHHHNILSPPHHLNTLSLRTQPSAGLPRTVGTTSLPPAAR